MRWKIFNIIFLYYDTHKVFWIAYIIIIVIIVIIVIIIIFIIIIILREYDDD